MMDSDLHCDLKIDRDDMSFEDQIRCTGEAILEHAEGVCAEKIPLTAQTNCILLIAKGHVLPRSEAAEPAKLLI